MGQWRGWMPASTASSAPSTSTFNRSTVDTPSLSTTGAQWARAWDGRGGRIRDRWLGVRWRPLARPTRRAHAPKTDESVTSVAGTFTVAAMDASAPRAIQYTNGDGSARSSTLGEVLRWGAAAKTVDVDDAATGKRIGAPTTIFGREALLRGTVAPEERYSTRRRTRRTS